MTRTPVACLHHEQLVKSSSAQQLYPNRVTTVLLLVLQVVVDKVHLYRHGNDAVHHVRCASVLAHLAAILVVAVRCHDEAANQAHDQVQVLAVQHRQEGEWNKATAFGCSSVSCCACQHPTASSVLPRQCRSLLPRCTQAYLQLGHQSQCCTCSVQEPALTVA